MGGCDTAIDFCGRDDCGRLKVQHRAVFCPCATETTVILENGIIRTLDGSLPHVLNFSVDGVDSEALMVGLRDLVAISNGSACTSQSYAPSHVLKAMGLPAAVVAGAVRMSWCHLTPTVDWETVAGRIASLR